jgi:hypothetical protein
MLTFSHPHLCYYNDIACHETIPHFVAAQNMNGTVLKTTIYTTYTQRSTLHRFCMLVRICYQSVLPFWFTMSRFKSNPSEQSFSIKNDLDNTEN